jgi:hypothetical protein
MHEIDINKYFAVKLKFYSKIDNVIMIRTEMCEKDAAAVVD